MFICFAWCRACFCPLALVGVFYPTCYFLFQVAPPGTEDPAKLGSPIKSSPTAAVKTETKVEPTEEPVVRRGARVRQPPPAGDYVLPAAASPSAAAAAPPPPAEMEITIADYTQDDFVGCEDEHDDILWELLDAQRELAHQVVRNNYARQQLRSRLTIPDLAAVQVWNFSTTPP